MRVVEYGSSPTLPKARERSWAELVTNFVKLDSDSNSESSYKTSFEPRHESSYESNYEKSYDEPSYELPVYICRLQICRRPRIGRLLLPSLSLSTCLSSDRSLREVGSCKYSLTFEQKHLLYCYNPRCD